MKEHNDWRRFQNDDLKQQTGLKMERIQAFEASWNLILSET